MPLSPDQLKPHLEGVFGFPITPFHQDGTLNLDALRRHVCWMAGTGVSTISDGTVAPTTTRSRSVVTGGATNRCRTMGRLSAGIAM